MSTTQLRPFNINAAWKGEELFSRPEWQFKLSPDEVDELMSAGERLQVNADATGAEPDSIELPLLEPKLKQIQDLLENGSGAARLLGFPVADTGIEIARNAFWALVRHIGTPVSQSASGERIFSVRDAGFAADDKRARGPNSRKKLGFHTDRSDVIGFLCYRQAQSGGENQLVSSVAIFNQMLSERPDLVDILMQPYLYQRHNVDTGNELPYCEQPIFSSREGKFAANMLRVLIERAYASPDTPDMTDQQREALDYVESVAERPEFHVTFTQDPGDMLFLNNWVTFHRRTEFVDHPEPELKRHLLRVWLSVPNSRAIDPRFAGNYGQTDAGAIRGGMNPKR